MIFGRMHTAHVLNHNITIFLNKDSKPFMLLIRKPPIRLLPLIFIRLRGRFPYLFCYSILKVLKLVVGLMFNLIIFFLKPIGLYLLIRHMPSAIPSTLPYYRLPIAYGTKIIFNL